VSGQQHAPAALYPRERPGTHFTVGWVGSRAGLDGRKISFPPGFDPGPSSPMFSIKKEIEQYNRRICEGDVYRTVADRNINQEMKSEDQRGRSLTHHSEQKGRERCG